MSGDAERDAIGVCATTLDWLLDGDCDLDGLHAGLRHTLIAGRTQIDAAVKLAALTAKEPA